MTKVVVNKENVDKPWGGEEVGDYFPENPDATAEGDVIRRRWLDNDFWAFVYSLNYRKNKLNMYLGGGYNTYDGDHFGEVIWAEFASQSDIRDRYYDGNSLKNDLFRFDFISSFISFA